MRVLPHLSFLLLAGGSFTSAASTSNCTSNSTCTLTTSDTKLLQYTFAISKFVNNFYALAHLNQSVAKAASNITSPPKALSDLKGIAKENNLTITAIQELSSKAPKFKAPTCNYTYPKINSTQSFVKFAHSFESTLSAAFIGAAGFTQSPEVSFLLARLAAQHAAHAVWIGSRLNTSMFLPNASSLLPAFTPRHVLMPSNMTGSLGKFLHGCVTAPTSPCGTLKIGPLEANTSSSSPPRHLAAIRRFW